MPLAFIFPVAAVAVAGVLQRFGELVVVIRDVLSAIILCPGLGSSLLVANAGVIVAGSLFAALPAVLILIFCHRIYFRSVLP